MKFRILDAQGRELAQPGSVFDGPVLDRLDLLLPGRSTLSFDVSLTGWGVSQERAGQLEAWTFPRDVKDYYLHAVLEVPESNRGGNDFARPWYGKIEMPPVLVPLKAEKFDPAKLAPLIEELGRRMLEARGDVSYEASHALSLDDGQHGSPVLPESGEPDPEDPVTSPQLGAFDGVLVNGHLLPQCEVFGGQDEPGQ